MGREARLGRVAVVTRRSWQLERVFFASPTVSLFLDDWTDRENVAVLINGGSTLSPDDYFVSGRRKDERLFNLNLLNRRCARRFKTKRKYIKFKISHREIYIFKGRREFSRIRISLYP